MRPLLLVLLQATFLLFAQAIDYDYGDDNQLIDRDINRTDEYPVLAYRLNCSALVLRHKGVKTEEIILNDVYKRDPTPVITDDASRPLMVVYAKSAGYDTKSAENDSTEKPINEKKKSKRATVIFERMWTAKNISIIDGYSKVAIYPIHAEKEAVAEEITENGTTECTAAFDDDGDEYRWYQVIVENGGPPGGVNATRLTPNFTEVLEPCRRPITNTSPPLEDLLYEYESIIFEKVYRHERAFLRFAGTPSEFVDIVGQLVWAPPADFVEHRYYRLSYRKDDTGFYVNVRRRHKCVFEKNPLSVNCHLVDDFIPCVLGPGELFHRDKVDRLNL